MTSNSDQIKIVPQQPDLEHSNLQIRLFEPVANGWFLRIQIPKQNSYRSPRRSSPDCWNVVSPLVATAGHGSRFPLFFLFRRTCNVTFGINEFINFSQSDATDSRGSWQTGPTRARQSYRRPPLPASQQHHWPSSPRLRWTNVARRRRRRRCLLHV